MTHATAKHTPIAIAPEKMYPKHAGKKTLIINIEGSITAETFGCTVEEAEDFARHIVHCVNCHDELVETLKYISKECLRDGFVPAIKDDIYNVAKQALAKAEEK